MDNNNVDLITKMVLEAVEKQKSSEKELNSFSELVTKTPPILFTTCPLP